MPNRTRYIAIMAGGIGSRFWPASTKKRPKQFLDILGVGKSLLRLTYERSLKLVPKEQILIVTNKAYSNLVQEHLPELPKENILGEPSMNNTAPCVAWCALHIRAIAPDAVFAVLPSDHVILDEMAYIDVMNRAFDHAQTTQALITLGIQPSRPDTGYGYIQRGKQIDEDIYIVEQFREKPDFQTAKQYLEDGDFLWNAGMFIWSVESILQSFDKHAKQILKVLLKNQDAFGSDQELRYIDKVYPDTEKISIDYAILERADNVYTIPADIGWSDLGTWNSLYEYQEKDDNASVVTGSDIHLFEVRHTLVRSATKRTIVIKGLDNYIVVDEDEALLIYPKSKEQEIKQVVKNLKGS